MDKFKCNICNREHYVYWHMKKQDIEIVLNIPEEQLNKRISSINGFFFLVDKKHVLVNAILSIGVKNKQQEMTWEVWVQFPVEDFLNFSEKSLDEINGTLMSNLFFYDSNEPVLVTLKFDLEGQVQYPEIISIKTNNGKLKRDFDNGISSDELISWMQKLHHPTLPVE